MVAFLAVSDLENLPPFKPIAALKTVTSTASDVTFSSEVISTKNAEWALKGSQITWFHLSYFYIRK